MRNATLQSATLHVLCGKAGSGKTTLALELGRTLPAVVFCEDAWLHRLGFQVRTLDDYLQASARVRSVIGPLAVELLRLGVSVVFDFAGNTARSRRWVRSLFEEAGAAHVVHLLEASDAQCLENLHRRNAERPEGVYWGQVSDALFHAVTAHFAPPTPEEGFHVVRRGTVRSGPE
jgi:predicted kinase